VTTPSQRYGVNALERGLTILETVGASPRALSLRDVATRCRVPKTTAFRLLATLEGRGFVERDAAGAYRVGRRAARLAQGPGGADELRRLAHPFIQRLHRLSQDTVNLAQWRDDEIVYVDVVASRRPLRFVEDAGSIAPMHATALGKVVAAQLTDPQVRARLRRDGMPKYTARTITSVSRYLAEIHGVRERGHAEDREEHDEGAACVAAPVFDAQGVAGAISISAPASRMTADRIRRLAPPLVEACEALSRQLGHRRRRA